MGLLGKAECGGAGIKRILLLLFLIAITGSSMVRAEDFKRFEFQAYGGFTASGDIPLESEEGVQSGSIRVDSSYNVGATVSVNLNYLDTIEGRWQRQFTEGRLPAEIVTPQPTGGLPSFDLDIDQIHINFIHHYEIKDARTMPYILGGLGATVYHAGGYGQSESMVYFSFALGAGVKYYVNSHFGLRGEVRWSPTVLSSDSSYWCSIGGSGANCEILLIADLQNELDLTGGVFFRF